jgi:hypothetical protein
MFLLWTAIAGISSFFIFLIILPGEERNIPLFLMGFLILFYAQILGVFMFLGISGCLSPPYITAVFLFIIGISVYLCHREKIFTGIRGITFKPLPLSFLVLLSFIFALYYTVVYHSIMLPPLTTDGLLYHLPFAVDSYKTNSLSLCPLYFTEISMTYYPVGGSIFYHFCLYNGKEFLLKFVQMPFALMGMAAVYLMAKKGKYPLLLCIGAMGLFAFLKPVLKESALSYVDLIMTGTFAATLYCFSAGNRRLIPLGILSAAICVSTKNFAPMFILVLLPFLFKMKEGTVSKKYLALSILFFLFAGGFTYVRNIILTRNPFFPAEITFGGFTLFKGVAVYSGDSFLGAFKNLVTFFRQPISMVDPNATVSLLLFVFLFISIVLSFVRDRDLFFVFLLVPVLIIIYVFTIPTNYLQIRHLLPLYAIFSLSFVYPFKYVKKLQWIPLVLLCFFIFETIGRPVLITRFMVTALIFFVAFYLPSRKKRYLLSLAAPCIFFIVLLLWPFILASDTYPSVKYGGWKFFYGSEAEMWEFVQKNSETEKNIAYIGEFLLYPFYGKTYSNRVFYQSVNSIETFPVHYYKEARFVYEKEKPEVIYRENPSFELWCEGLKQKKADWVVIKKSVFYVERNWIEENRKLFKKIFSNEVADIYEVVCIKDKPDGEN